MAPAVIESRKIGPYEVMTYLVHCPRTRLGVIIDPAGQADELAAWARDKGVAVTHILNTHGHPDHTLGNARLKQLLDATVAVHEADDDFFASEQGISVASDELGLPPPPPADLRLSDGQVLTVGDMEIRVIHTPGHTPGSACFLVDGRLFTGDTLFVGDVGRTDLGGASLERLLQSLEEKLLPLPDDTVVMPGHDYGETPTSTMGREKQENPYITDFILDD